MWIDLTKAQIEPSAGNAVADIKRAAELICAEPNLVVARLMDTRTGRMRSLK
jgi:hypothetical protein